MSGPIELAMGDTSVRFTSDGMIFIEDAIKALINDRDDRPSVVWNKLKEDHPGILDHCDSYATADGRLVQIIDIEGLDKIFLLLLEYMEGQKTDLLNE